MLYLSLIELILGLIRRINKRRLLANKDDKGNTDLDLAVENSQLEMVKLLVKEPLANVYAKNSDKQTALDIALQRLAYVARSAKALENSSCDENDYALAKFLEVLYKREFFIGRSVISDNGVA